MPKTNNQEYTEPLQEFVDGIKDFTPTDNSDDYDEIARQQATDLVYASFDSDPSNNEPIPTDRKSRKKLRGILPLSIDIIKQESYGDESLEKELQARLLRGVGRAGIKTDTVRVFENFTPKKPNAERTKQTTKDLVPTVNQEDKQYLEDLVAGVEDSGRWDPAATEKAALGFLDIYHPAQEKADNNRGSHQEVLDAIATCGTYSHAIASALSNLPSLEQDSRISDIKSNIVESLIERANHVELNKLSQYDSYTQGEIPEIQEFSAAIKGAQYEILARDALASLELDDINYSSIEEDVSYGYDLVLEKNEQKYYVDIKASKSFDKSVKKYREDTIVSDTRDRDYVVRTTNHKDENDKDINIIVIDAETSGDIKIVRNRLQLNSPEAYTATVEEAMRLVDNIGS